MKTFKINYTGNASRFKNKQNTVTADNAREAVVEFYELQREHDYLQQEDGAIFNAQGEEICGKNEQEIQFDGGYFSAIEIPEISSKLIRNELNIFVSLNDETVTSFPHRLTYCDDVDNVQEDLDYIFSQIVAYLNDDNLSITDVDMEEIKDKLEFYYGNCN